MGADGTRSALPLQLIPAPAGAEDIAVDAGHEDPQHLEFTHTASSVALKVSAPNYSRTSGPSGPPMKANYRFQGRLNHPAFAAR